MLDRLAGIAASRLGVDIPERDEDAWGKRVAFQLRMRTLAEHPELLLGYSDEPAVPKRAWHVRQWR
jgi:hypothetical protein